MLKGVQDHYLVSVYSPLLLTEKRARGAYRTSATRISSHSGFLDKNSVFVRNMRYFSKQWGSGVVSPLLPRQAFFIVCENQKKLENTSGFEYYASSCPFPASKYAIPTDENRHSAHRLKVTNLRNRCRASIGPKSKNLIFNILRRYNYKFVNLASGKQRL